MNAFLKDQSQRFVNRCLWSWNGFRVAFVEEPSLRQWVYANVVSAGLALAMDLSATERAMILALGILVLAFECVNTAVERCIDYISTEEHDLARVAKDTGSAAVAISAIATGVAWIVILIG